jgi:hypothetical protein
MRKEDPVSHANFRELAHREQDGLEVTLYWDKCSNDVSIEVVDHREESILWAPVAGHLALDAFHHPYAYPLSHDVDYESASATPITVAS